MRSISSASHRQALRQLADRHFIYHLLRCRIVPTFNHMVPLQYDGNSRSLGAGQLSGYGIGHLGTDRIASTGFAHTTKQILIKYVLMEKFEF